MPIFFILAGYTLKTISTKDMAKATLKDFKRLVIPVFVVLLVQIPLEMFFEDFSLKTCLKNILIVALWGADFANRKEFGFLWFLLALFYAKFFFRLLLVYVKNYREIFILFGTFIMVAADIHMPQSIDLLFPAAFFLDIGYILKNGFSISDDGMPKKLLPQEYMKIAGIIGFFLWIYMSWTKGIAINLAARSYPLSMLCFLVAFFGYFCIIQFSKALEQFHAIIRKPLIFFGKNSLELLCVHNLDRFFFKYWHHNLVHQDSFNEFLRARLNADNINMGLNCLFRILFCTAILVVFILAKKTLQKIILTGKVHRRA